MNFIVASLAVGVTFALVYYGIARWYLNRLERAQQRTQRPTYTNRLPLPILPLSKGPSREEVARQAAYKAIREGALEPYERNGRRA